MPGNVVRWGGFVELEKWKQQLLNNKDLFIGENTARRSAVLIPLVEVDGEWCILFEVRSSKMRFQPGDICFPGGRVDPDDPSLLFTALRETHEELGVAPDTVEVLGPLSPYVSSMSFVVYPFVGVVDFNEIITSYNEEEVEEVFTVPLSWLLSHEPFMHEVAVDITPDRQTFPFEKIPNGDQYQWRKRTMEEWFYEYGTYTIWGMTARILKHFIDVLRT